ncbi:MAG: inorganic phosphate transporter [Xenococcaceae cyanobacterium]
MSIAPQLLFIVPLAFYVAWNLGANDVANSMGTSVGSKALSLKQALIIAGILEFTGAVIFGRSVSTTLATEVANPELFANTPQLLVLGMVSVLLSGGIWLQIATSRGLPVSSSHAVVGAIAGFSWVAAGKAAVDWQNIGFISLGWLVTPLISGAIAAAFYNLIKFFILDRVDPLKRLQEWIPWLSSILFAVFGVIVFPTLFKNSFWQSLPIPTHVLSLITGAIAAISLSFFSWQQLEKLQGKEEKFILENILGRFQIVSACFVAFAHGSNDVGNAIAPLAAIVYIQENNSVPLFSFSIPLWILIVGGLGIVTGLAVQGKNVIATVGENIISLQPSIGFSAEIATAITVLLASSFGLPVSTSHALIGSVVGIGLSKNFQEVRLETLKSVLLAWFITVPFAAILGAIIFLILRSIF